MGLLGWALLPRCRACPVLSVVPTSLLFGPAYADIPLPKVVPAVTEGAAYPYQALQAGAAAAELLQCCRSMQQVASCTSPCLDANKQSKVSQYMRLQAQEGCHSHFETVVWFDRCSCAVETVRCRQGSAL